MTLDLKIGIILYFIIIIEYCIMVMYIIMKSKRSVKITALLINCSFSILWMFTVIIEKLFLGTDYFIYIIRLPIIFAQLSNTSVLLFVLFHLEILKPVNKWYSIIIFIPRIICFIPFFTEKYFYLVIEEYVNNSMIVKWGPVINIGKMLSYSYISIALILLIFDYLKNKKFFISNFLVTIGVTLPLAIHLLTEFKIIKPNVIDYSPMVFSVVIILFTVSIFKYRNDDVIHQGSYELFNQTKAFVLIISKDGIIEDYNREFEKLHSLHLKKGETKIFEIMEKIYAGSTDEEVIDNLRKDLAEKTKETKRHILTLEHKKDTKSQYIFDIIPIYKKEKHYFGKLIIVYDNSEQRETNILEERRRVSDDLHDSIGNSINVLGLNLEYIVRKLKSQEFQKIPEIDDVLECAKQSYQKTTDAFIDLRRIIDNLCPVDIEKNGIVWALDSFFYKIRIKGIKIEFLHSEIDDELINSHQISSCLYSICQEGINNAIIHGKASEIFVALMQNENEFVFNMVDNGIGCAEVIANKGISGMEKRVRALRGTAKYGNLDEEGFFIKISIPIN